MSLRFDVVCLLPAIVQAALSEGVIARAAESGAIDVRCTNPRDFTDDAHQTVDDRPYGGGPGMVLLYEPLARAHAAARGQRTVRTVALSAQGVPFTHAQAVAAADGPDLILIAGRYEGIDERFLEAHVDEQWSLGDYVLSGGELAAAVVIDAIARLRPGVLGCAESAAQDSFADGLLDCPHYTRPEEIAGRRVPEVLLSGDHAAIAQWRRKQMLGRTARLRPELLEGQTLSAADRALLAEYEAEMEDTGD